MKLLDLDRLNAPAAPHGLALLRIGFGLLMAIECLRYAFTMVKPLFHNTQIHFGFPGLTWVEPLGGWGMQGVFIGAAGAALGLAIGWQRRFCALWFTVLWGYGFLAEATHYQNHHYFITIMGLLWCFVPGEATWSWDARQSKATPCCVRQWHYDLMRFQIGLVYVFGAINKLTPDWLSMRTIGFLVEQGRLPLWLGANAMPGVTTFIMTYGGILFDAIVVPGLMFKRTRWITMGSVLFFHFSNHSTFTIGIFPWLMMAASIIFFEPEWITRWIGNPADTEKYPSTGHTLKKPTLMILSAWVIFHVLFPFRHWAYSGDVDWNMHGWYFGWRMMTASRQVNTQFVAHDPKTGERWALPLWRHVNARQLHALGHHPFLMMQMAEHFKDHLAEEGTPNAKITVEAYVGLNGRPLLRLIDNTVDMTAVSWGFGHSPWVLPAPTDDAPHDQQSADE